ncbi:MAG: prepilin-type N-terminal cleavage/methylation domain-containing protein [Lysobacter sp.]
MRAASRPTNPARVRGFSLIELMIALILGLVVVAAAGGIFISNKRSFNATETIGRIQENGRVAFELMARDVRESSGTPCGKNIPIANVLEDASFDWGVGLKGYGGSQAVTSVAFGTTPGLRVAGTDAVEFKSATDGLTSVSKHNPASATIHLGKDDHPFKDDDILIICDYASAAIFQVTGPTTPVLHVVHNTGTGSIGNSCKALSFPVDPSCSTKPKDGKKFANNSIIAKYTSTLWFVGYNARGGKSLYRKVYGVPAEEITEGVDNMDLTYLVPGQSSYAAATAVGAGDWTNVNAVRIALSLQAAVGALSAREIEGTTKGQALTRQLVHTVTLRNRMP